jgi:hypothetical protein
MMLSKIKQMAATLVLCTTVVSGGAVNADELITSFETFFEDALYNSWASPTAVIDSGPESYTITATGYGSNYVYIGGLGILGAGNTDIQLDVTLSGPPEAEAMLGPLVQLIDEDGTHYHYRWYGQLLGNNILTKKIESPDFISNPGTVAGLDLDTLTHMHMELDPGGYGTTGPYTVSWNELSLITVEGTPGDFDGDGDVDGRDFLAWQRGESPTPLSAGDLSDWQAAYGNGPLASLSAVPEPGTICLMFVASISVLGFKRPSRPVA